MSEPTSMDEDLRREYLRALGVELWVRRVSRENLRGAAVEAPVVTPEPAAEPAPVRDREGLPHSEGLDWEQLEARVRGCTACALHTTRTQTVFGVGDRQARWMLIGEAPGADEDRQGEPFVGRAGQLLNAMLQAVGLRREEVYIANILKCRPPANRDPFPAEVASCERYLQRQIELIRPCLILALGRIAAQSLLRTDANIGSLRGRPHPYRDSGIPVVITYHPAFLLRSPQQKRRAWEDLKLARKLAREGAGAHPGE